MNTTAERIKELVTMDNILLHYGFSPSRYGRIPCPLHNGKDKNFSYKKNSFKCFVCGKSGSVIDFVMELYGINFRQATLRIDRDFGLGIYGNKPDRIEFSKIMAERRAKEESEREAEEEYKNLAAEHRYWHEVAIVFAPEKPETYSSAYIHPLYAEAVKRLTYLEYITDEKIMARR